MRAIKSAGWVPVLLVEAFCQNCITTGENVTLDGTILLQQRRAPRRHSATLSRATLPLPLVGAKA